MRAIGNIGAWPVYRSERDIPPELARWPGSRFAVVRPGGYEIFEAQALRTGLSGFWSSLISIGGIVAAPFTGGASLLVTAGSQAAAGIVGGIEAKGAQAKEIGKQFDQLAGQVTSLFNSIQSKPVITAEDVRAAEAALGQLASVAQQYSSIEYVSRQWNSAAYRPAYEQRLSQIRAAAQTPAAQVAGGTGGQPASSQGLESGASLVLPAIAVLGALLLLRR